MGLPPPKLRDLASWIEKNSTADINGTEVWEIGVPAKMSLPWSIVLSVLFSESAASFPDLLGKLTGGESEIKEIKGKKRLSLPKINPQVVKEKLDSFNPFKNRHNFFHWVEISEIVRIFDLRLKRYANSIKSKTDEWNDDWKLKAASKFLDCNIDVYFPKRRRFIAYEGTSRASLANIILFQYEDQLHGKRKDPINIFNFAMNLQRAHNLKLDALRHFLKKAKIDNSSIEKVIKLMNRPEAHGRAFLPTIIGNSCTDILPEIYRSPYIAFKLSEAGFETDPIARISCKPSPLCCVLLWSTNQEHVTILYDYASNCRSLFDRSVRRADDTVLNNLRQIKSVVESDISILNCPDFVETFSTASKKRAVRILDQLNRFIEYQFKIAYDLTNLKEKLKDKDIKTPECRKRIMQVIGEHFLNFFCYEKKSQDMTQQLKDFVQFTEYYGFTDNFFYISFFDNFFKLKLLFGLKEEDTLSSDIEGKICLAIKSNIYFPRLHPKKCEVELDAISDERSILRYIPLHYRNVVESEVGSLLRILKDSEDSKLKEKLAAGSHSYPYIIDEVIMSRLNKYLEAVQELSPNDDGMKTVLVIERAMQVIGESIKPPSSMGSIVSFFLRSCLPTKLQEAFISIRNDLSKYRCNSVYGKLKIEGDTAFFEGIQKELKQIQDTFKIVNLTQDSRIEKSVMSDCLNQLTDNLESNALNKFKEGYTLHLNQKKLHYEKYHRKCIELLLDSFSDISKQSKKIFLNYQLQIQHLFGQLKSVEYLLEFILNNKHEEYLNNLLDEVQIFLKLNNEKHNDEIEKLINNNDELKKMKNMGKKLNEMIKESSKMKEVVEKHLNEWQQNLSKWKDEILKHNPKKDTTLCASNIESFFKLLKIILFSEEEMGKIISSVAYTLREAVKAQCDLKEIFKGEFQKESIPKVDELLKKIPLPDHKLDRIRSCYENKKSADASLKSLRCFQEESIKNNIKIMLEEGSLNSGYALTVLTKIVFQRNLYPTSPKLPEEIYKKLENFLTNKVTFLLNRVKILKNILIDEDEEIRATWQWGRSEAIKYHLKFLMRQRYMREATVRSALEMADFDCVNIFHSPLPVSVEEKDDRADSNNSLATLYEKSNNLFAGYDLRHLLSHRNNIPEAIGEVLDKDDFPSELIEKVLKLINDADAIEAILELLKKSGVIEKKTFTDGIKYDKFLEKHAKLVATIKSCDRWEKYVDLFPFIK